MPMTSTLIIITLIALAGLAWFIVPLLRPEQRTKTSDEVVQQQLERLLVYYEQVMATLRDIEEDHMTGKLNDDDYMSERERWASRGVKVLDAMNQIRPMPMTELPTERSAKAPARDRREDDLDAAIEAAVAKAMGGAK